jgi:hypothetical protein
MAVFLSQGQVVDLAVPSTSVIILPFLCCLRQRGDSTAAAGFGLSSAARTKLCAPVHDRGRALAAYTCHGIGRAFRTSSIAAAVAFTVSVTTRANRRTSFAMDMKRKPMLYMRAA